MKSSKTPRFSISKFASPSLFGNGGDDEEVLATNRLYSRLVDYRRGHLVD